MKIGKYVCTSNNYSTRQESSLCVKLDGAIMAKMKFTEALCDPLRQIQMHPNNPYRAELIAQLRSNGVPDEDITDLLRVRPSKYYLAKMAKENS